MSVRILTIKISQWARANFCSYRKICFRCKFSFPDKQHSSQAQVWQWRDFPDPITILSAMHSNQSVSFISYSFIVNRLRQIALFLYIQKKFVSLLCKTNRYPCWHLWRTATWNLFDKPQHRANLGFQFGLYLVVVALSFSCSYQPEYFR